MSDGSFAPKPGDRILLVVPHPDDEVLATGVLIQRAVAAGATLHVVFATRGEANVWVQRLVDRRWRITPSAQEAFAGRRREEALEALRLLGVEEASTEFLGLPDTGITDLLLEGGEEGTRLLRSALERLRPTLLVGPSTEDLHPDHSALAVLVRLAVRGLPPAGRPSTTLAYTVHRRRGAPHVADVELRPTRSERERKRQALLCHRAPLTVHRRDFLPRCRDAERFRTLSGGPEPATGVLESVAGGSALRIGAAPRPGAWGRRTLHLLGERDAAIRTSLVAEIDRRPDARWAALAERKGGQVAGRLRVRRDGRLRRVRLPLDVDAAVDCWYAKIERRRGFYDEGGWLEVVPEAPHEEDARGRGPVEARPGAGVAALIPCYDVADFCAPVVREAAALAERVFAIDDGSRDGTGRALEGVALSCANVEILSFAPNRGKGAVLLEGFRRALESGPYDVLVTLDGDGQHRAADIPAVAAAVRRGAELAIGTRTPFSRMPSRSRVGNSLTSALVRRRYPKCPLDTQSGFRAFSREHAEDVVAHVPGRRYETELTILLRALGKGRSIASVPIPILYLDGNRSSHFRPLVDSARIYRRLFSALFRTGGPTS